MSYLNICLLKKMSENEKQDMFIKKNHLLEKLSAFERIEWALKYLPKNFVLSSSFGINAFVSLHMITKIFHKIPIIFIDTGYLFPETYQFADTINKKLNLNLKIFSSIISSKWQEVRYGKLWEQGIKGIEKYNYINKIEPMYRGLKKLNCQTWFSGLRRVQSKSRAHLPILSVQKNFFKFLPIVDWNNKKIFQYIKKNNLIHHPLENQGYVSLGDVHTTTKLESGMKEEETRFFGLKRECGLHKK